MKPPLFFLALLTLMTGALFAQEVEKLSEPKTLLFIRTVPEGARVLIDGNNAGATDDLFSVEPGVRRIVIELDGHTPQSKELTIRAGQITRLVLQLKKPELAQETALPSFGPAIERVVNDDKTGSDWMIDLETGNLYTPPTELDPEQNPQADIGKLKAWVRQQGIDATGIKAQGGELQFIEPVLAIVDKASWESVTEQQVRDALAEVVEPPDKAVVGNTLYAFRTREGGMGVLQVVECRGDSPSVAIRYKLLSRDVVLKGEGKEGTDSEARAEQVARSYFDSLMRGDAKKAASLSAVPFSFDGKRTVNTIDDLERLYQEIAKTKGSREVTPSRVVAFQGGDDPNIAVMMWMKDDSISIYVKPGKEYRVVGFSD